MSLSVQCGSRLPGLEGPSPTPERLSVQPAHTETTGWYITRTAGDSGVLWRVQLPSRVDGGIPSDVAGNASWRSRRAVDDVEAVGRVAAVWEFLGDASVRDDVSHETTMSCLS